MKSRLTFFAAGAALCLSLVTPRAIPQEQPQDPAGTTQDSTQEPATLTDVLREEDPSALSEDIQTWGNSTRGAILFHQPQLQCAKCHLAPVGETAWGPDLTEPEDKLEGADLASHIAASLLDPAKKIRKGFESEIVALADGRVVTGVKDTETADMLILRDPRNVGKLIEIPKSEIEEREIGINSAMPEGLVNVLSNRQQFLDLAKFVTEVAASGKDRLNALQPASAMFALAPVPEYENDIDHRRLITSLDRESFKRGRQIYDRVCANCHGTKDREGSLPTSRRFGQEPFKAGADPFSLYQTLTHGFGLMAAQRWMVPRQKYDVIHYVREAYVKSGSPSQYTAIDEAYLDRLPVGSQLGPEPSALRPWSSMDYGPALTATYETGNGGDNIAQKGIAIRLDPGYGGVARGQHWMLFEHDTLRMAAGWSGDKFVDWKNIMFDGQHGVHSRVVGDVAFQTHTAPGWANPATGEFDDDQRVIGRDGKRYGPLPRDWGHYRGQYRYGDRIILSYTIGDAEVLEMPAVDTSGEVPFFLRTFNIGPRKERMRMRIADFAPADARLSHQFTADQSGVFHVLSSEKERQAFAFGISSAREHWVGGTPPEMVVEPGDEPVRFTLAVGIADNAEQVSEAAGQLSTNGWDLDLSALMQGGPAAWPEKLTTQASVRPDSANGPLVAEDLTHPEENPWLVRTRFTGFDFYPDGDRVAVSAWDGDVWLVSGLLSPDGKLTWQRIASGLFQPLGVKVVDDSVGQDRIYVTCRDQIVILNDLNGDGETDFYENFNSDHQVTEHFHEFAMGLQRDDDGNFYYAKSARHALQAVVPHHGTLLRVSPDGLQTDILATGFRAANGVCLNPDGSFFVTDQEGHWTPKNRINLVHEGGFYGNMFGYTDVTDDSNEAMAQPLCWITNAFDRSPAELLWVPENAWGPLGGALLDLSYGYGKIFVIPHETVDGQIQGGLSQLPIPQFPTGLCRGRFHPLTGDLYTCGMFAWAGDQTDPGGFYRVRYAEKPVHAPIALHATPDGMQMTFTEAVDSSTASRVENYSVKVWTLKRSKNYGSPHVDEHPLQVTAAKVTDGGKTVTLSLAEMAPTMCMEIRYQLKDAEGQAFTGVIHNTVHNLGEK